MKLKLLIGFSVLALALLGACNNPSSPNLTGGGVDITIDLPYTHRILSVGGTESLTATVTVEPATSRSYQWYRSDTGDRSAAAPVSGMNSATLAIPSDDAGTAFFFLRVTAGATTEWSNAVQVEVVTINVLAPPTNVELTLSAELRFDPISSPSGVVYLLTLFRGSTPVEPYVNYPVVPNANLPGAIIEMLSETGSYRIEVRTHNAGSNPGYSQYSNAASYLMNVFAVDVEVIHATPGGTL
ncbi:MAG: hypothetical protein FWC65_03520, partial [Treponema sp.]|nr:hypothetical protein [Treponema sp.]